MAPLRCSPKQPLRPPSRPALGTPREAPPTPLGIAPACGASAHFYPPLVYTLFLGPPPASGNRPPPPGHFYTHSPHPDRGSQNTAAHVERAPSCHAADAPCALGRTYSEAAAAARLLPLSAPPFPSSAPRYSALFCSQMNASMASVRLGHFDVGAITSTFSPACFAARCVFRPYTATLVSPWL